MFEGEVKEYPSTNGITIRVYKNDQGLFEADYIERDGSCSASVTAETLEEIEEEINDCIVK